MKKLFEAFYRTVTNASIGLTGGFFNTQAPANAVSPYGVFSMIGNKKEVTFSGTAKRVVIQIQLCSTDVSSKEVNDLYDALIVALDDAQFSIETWDLVDCQEDNSSLIKQNDTWVYVCTFELLLSCERGIEAGSSENVMWDVLQL